MTGAAEFPVNVTISAVCGVPITGDIIAGDALGADRLCCTANAINVAGHKGRRIAMGRATSAWGEWRGYSARRPRG